MDLHAELFAVIEALASERVDYAICGGLAMALHGHPRPTGDIDLLIQEPDLGRARRALAAIGWAIDAGLFWFDRGEATERKLWSVFRAMDDRLLPVDLLLVGDFLSPVWRDREWLPLGSRDVSVVGRAGLMRMKRAAGRQPDLDDVAQLGTVGAGDARPRAGATARAGAKPDVRRASILDGAASCLARLLTPALHARCEALVKESPELRVLSQLLDPAGAAAWVHSIGVARDPGIAALLPPVPPVELRAAVAEDAVEVFLASGVEDCRRILDAWGRFGDAALERSTLLDFGSGCGRIARFLSGHGHPWSLVACDPDAAHAAWCRMHLPCTVVETPRQPPLPWPDGRFDCVYAIGVFTQLPEHAGMAWLAELARITRIGGLVILSVHGETALRTIAGSRRHQDVFRVAAAGAESMLPPMQEPAWLFVQHDEEGLRLARGCGEYGVAFVSPRHVRERWNQGPLLLVAHEFAGLRGFDDLVILKRVSRA